MDYCSRGSLYDVMNDVTFSLDWSLFFKISLQICEAIKFLHTNNPQIVHRDLKVFTKIFFLLNNFL